MKKNYKNKKIRLVFEHNYYYYCFLLSFHKSLKASRLQTWLVMFWLLGNEIHLCHARLVLDLNSHMADTDSLMDTNHCVDNNALMGISRMSHFYRLLFPLKIINTLTIILCVLLCLDCIKREGEISSSEEIFF